MSDLPNSNSSDRRLLGEQTRLWLAAISSDLRLAVQHEVDGLRTSIDQRVAALEAVVSRNDEVFEQLTLKVHHLATEEAEAAATQARQRAEAAAQAEMSAATASLQAELESARAEFDFIRTALETQLAETERDITAIRRKRDDHAASLDEARQRIDALEEANAQMARLRQVADARLEEELQRRTTVAMQLDAARQEILLAKAEADSCRLEATVAGERVQTLENRLLQLEEAAAQIRTTSALNGGRPIVLENLKKMLDDLGGAKAEELLSRLVEHLSESFAATAVFTVEAQKLKLRKGRVGDSAAPDLAAAALSLEAESPLARAFRHRTTVSVDASSAEGGLGLWDMPLGHAIALPVVAYGRVVALAYAENPPGQSTDRVRMVETIAEILVGCVNQRLQRHQSGVDVQPSPQANVASVATESDPDVVTRQARRVKIDPAVEVLVDGAASRLVDLSARGAQIVSTIYLRPNRSVRIVLPSGTGSLTCEGRIVWARVDTARAEGPAMYRAGVRLAGVDPAAMMTFIAQHRAAEVIS